MIYPSSVAKTLLAIQSLSYLLTNSYAANTCAVDLSARSSCGTDGGIQLNSEACLAKGCCWMQTYQTVSSTNCYQSAPAATSGYQLSNYLETATGFTALLTLQGSNNVYGADIKNLKLDVVYHTSDVVQVKITDAKNQRWEVPESILPRHQPDYNREDSLFTVKFSENPFTLQIIRKSDLEVVFNLDSLIIYQDQYIEFSVLSDNTNRNTFGFGESTRTNHALTFNHIYTLWAADIGAMTMNQNLYGSYPMYLQQIKDASHSNLGAAHGGLLLNSNGMDVTLLADRINYKVLGGVIDYYVFVGSSPKQVVSQATTVFGKPAMVPYWSLGFHNCRWGYKNLDQVKEVVANYSAAKIPLDTQWVDIDHMEAYRDFTLSSKNFPADEMKSFVDQLHANGQSFVPIIDPGIMVYPGYDAYEKGLQNDLFIKDLQGNNYMGMVWPGQTYFPDFLHPRAQDYWTEQLSSFYSLVNNDGIWIDMNEISNFCNQDGNAQVCTSWDPNHCDSYGCCVQCSTVDPTNSLDFPKYHINHMYGKLSTKTIAMSNQHYNNATVYNMHNLYGLTEQIASHNAMQSIRNKRPFVLSRSSFLSTGVHSAKWTGDNQATWDDLKSSIISLFDFNIFSVPMIGADICGFNGNTNEELCARWIEVGAFYPFSRDHNSIDGIPQELYLWESVTSAAQKALGMRYQMLPYYYTLFFDANQNGNPVIQSLWMNYPTEKDTYDIEDQFMIGSAIMISPVIKQGSTNVHAYFPAGLWYDFTSKKLVIDSSNNSGHWVDLATPLTETNVHIAGGHVVALQDAAMTTSAGRQTPFTFVAALCEHGKAKGALFWDDGDQVTLSQYVTMKFEVVTDVKGGTFTAKINTNTYADAKNHQVGSVVVTGKALAVPHHAFMNGMMIAAENWSFDAAANIITFKNLNLPFGESFEIKWW